MSALAEAVIETLPPGGSRLLAVVGDDGRLSSEFIYRFRTPDGSESLVIGPMPMPALKALASQVEPIDSKMAEHMRNMLATWQAEQAGIGGSA